MSVRAWLRYRSRLHHIGVGNAYKRWRVILLVAGREVRILDLECSPLRRLILDPSKDYQPRPRPVEWWEMRAFA